MNDTTSTWRFSAFDTWFFRESRPMETIGGAELSSLFPPPMTTLAGALRTAIGDNQLVDWTRWAASPEYAELRRLIGAGSDLGELSLQGPWLSCNSGGRWKRLYPAPMDLLVKWVDERPAELHRLCIGPPRQCDLGPDVRLACMPKEAVGAKPPEDLWITATTLGKVLNGGTPEPHELIQAKQLFGREPRLGIARDNRRRTVEEGLLYQTSHIRPRPELAIEVDVSGLPEALHPPRGMLRLGGEGRPAHVEISDQAPEPLPLPEVPADCSGISLLLLTPLAVPEVPANPENPENPARPVPLPGFERDDNGGSTYWHGRINEIELSIHCAILGRAQREGGWDLAGDKPRPVRSLIPAGSLFYAKVEQGTIAAALNAIRGQQLGDPADLALGRGRLAAGMWPRDTDTE